MIRLSRWIALAASLLLTATGANARTMGWPGPGPRLPPAEKEPEKTPEPADQKSDAPDRQDGAGEGGQGGETASAGADAEDALDCQFPEEAPAEADLAVVCRVASGLAVTRVVLHYRPPGRIAFLPQTLRRAPDGAWRGTIPGNLLAGRSVHFYLMALDRRGRPLAASGGDDRPQVVVLRPKPAPAGAALAPPAPPAIERGAEENPLEVRALSDRPFRRRDVFVALGVGDGYGWKLGGGSAAAPALDVQVAPELGMHVAPRVAISVLGRHQWIEQPPADARGVARSAHAALARLLLYSGVGQHRFFGAVMAGAGDGFRLVEDARADETSGVPGRRTVRGGPFLGGLGVGYALDLERSPLSLIVEMDALAGAPDTAVVIDARLGLALFF